MGSVRVLCAALVWILTLDSCTCLRIAWLVPGPESASKINSDTSVAALKLALRSVEKTSKGSGKNVRVKFFDTDCTSQAATSSMFAQRSYSPDVIIGPPCTAAMKSVAQLAGFWNIPLFGWYNPDIEFENTKDYPTLIRMTPSATIMAQSLIHILHQNGWRRFVLLHDAGHVGLTIKDAVVSQVSRTPDTHMVSARSLDDSLTNPELVMMFRNLKKHATIFVFACGGCNVRRYLLAADKVGMTRGQHVFIQLDYEIYSGSHLQNTLLSDGTWRRGDLDDEDARRAYETLIHVVLDPMCDDGKTTRNLPKSRYEEFSQLALAGADLTKPEWELPAISKKSGSLFPTSSVMFPDVYSLYLYDSVVVWSVLVDVLNRSGIDHTDGQLLAHMAKNFFADGATGFIQLDENMDRIGKVFLLDMGYDGNFKPVQVLRFNKTNGYEVKNLVPVSRMFRWSSDRRGIQQTPSDIPSKTTPVPTPRVTAAPITTKSTTASTTTTQMTTSKPTTPTPAPDPMSLIMERLAALEAFLTKPKTATKNPNKQDTFNNANTAETTTKPPQRRRNRKGNKNGLNALKDSFAASTQGGTRKRGGKRKWTQGARRTGKRVNSGETEQEGRKQRRRKRPTTTTTIPTPTTFYDWYETTTAAQMDVPAGPADFSAAMDHLFTSAVDSSARNNKRRRPKGGRGIGVGRKGTERNRLKKKKGMQSRKQGKSGSSGDGFRVLNKNDLHPIKVADPFASDPMIDQISAQVAARISNSISKKLSAAKNTMKKKDKNYAVSIIGDWIPGAEDGRQKMNMTVKVDKTNNKDLKVTAQGMNVDNVISRKTIDTAKKRVKSVTIEPPKKGEQVKTTAATKNSKPTTSATNDVLTVTVAPPPPQVMYHPPPWPYMYATTPASWNSGESEGQPQPPQYPHPYPYPPPVYAYPPHQAPPPQQQSANQEGGQAQPYPQAPPPGYAPYPVYPMYGHYPGQWGQQQQSNSEVK